jgi:hypothetical protein
VQGELNACRLELLHAQRQQRLPRSAASSNSKSSSGDGGASAATASAGAGDHEQEEDDQEEAALAEQQIAMLKVEKQVAVQQRDKAAREITALLAEFKSQQVCAALCISILVLQCPSLPTLPASLVSPLTVSPRISCLLALRAAGLSRPVSIARIRAGAEAGRGSAGGGTRGRFAVAALGSRVGKSPECDPFSLLQCLLPSSVVDRLAHCVCCGLVIGRTLTAPS